MGATPIRVVHSPRRARLLIVDDHELVRAGVRKIINEQTEWEVCGEAANGKRAIEIVKQLMPDLVLLELSLPELNGFDVAMEIKRFASSVKVVLFSVYEIPATVRIADAFVAKADGASVLIATINRVLGIGRTAGVAKVLRFPVT